MHPLRPTFAFLAALAAAASSPLPAAAQRSAPERLAQVSGKGPDAVPQAAPKPSAGIVSGQVTSVDYQRGLLAVLSGGRKIDVTVLPSTNIQGKGGGYHSIAEIVRGAQVEIFTSIAEGKYTAQIIRLR